MLKKSIVLAGAFFVANNLFALEAPCPELNAIQAAGITAAVSDDTVFFGIQCGNFNTKSNWCFGIGPIESNSYSEVITLSNEILSSMHSSGIPEYSDGELYLCTYATGKPGIQAIANLDDDFSGYKKLKSKFYNSPYARSHIN